MKMKKYQFYIYVLASLICGKESAKILGIFPSPAKSHFTCNHAILKSLIEVGHEVTIITPFTEYAAKANYTSIIDTSVVKKGVVSQYPISELINESFQSLLNIQFQIEKSLCQKIINLSEIQRMLKSDKKLYDAIFVEISYTHHCYFPIAEKMNVPIIGTITFRSWLYTDRAIGNPNYPAYIPLEVGENWDPDSFLWRLRNVWNMITAEFYRHFFVESFVQKFCQDNVGLLGPCEKIFDIEPTLIFYNNHATFFPRPMNAKAIEIGGIHVEKAKPVPQKIEKFIDEAEHGVIIMTFGSVIKFSLSPPEIIDAFREAFAEIPQRVIWKFEEKLENLSDNVMLVDWLPQRDILEHGNVKAFISHCGQSGIYEAIHTATPVVAVPLFFDQSTGAAILENLGVSVRLNIHDISKETVLRALNEIINHTSYNHNMQKLSSRFKDRPMSPQQSVVYWTEYAIRHNDTSFLNPAANRLNWFEYLLLDILCSIVIIVGVTFWLSYRVIEVLRFCLRKFTKKSYNDLKEKKKLN